ncbi:GntR family transcriptional regulator [Teredinibacter sp. KSP-S5-2]|uniref:GntR family transcriptional regulator n=1 Tax=Teredinibacter sp. KSP-S5-2 TaxID=3034506 RepID=UPI0029351A3C|nr:GntR family transcriptional regulator [Teredinibacter sp. KSP-S5-2]WNO11310.1 GntR family transcriptional regulator [Teredinibacter sp. KSP-S5-2]
MSTDNRILDVLKSRLNDDLPTPLYIQIDQCLRSAIDEGLIADGDSLPSERAVAERLGVSRVTVRKSIERLEKDGFCRKVRGSGTFISAPKASTEPENSELPRSFCSLKGFSEDMRQRGATPSARMIERYAGQPTAEEVFSLGLQGESVYRYTRLRFADNQPVAIEVSSIPPEVLPSLESVSDSIYAALQKAGHKPSRALQRTTACALNAEQAAHLQTEEGAPALYIRRITYNQNNHPIEYTCSYHRADKFDFVAELISE